MSHLNPGELRRFLDEPETFDDASGRHARNCAACKTSLSELADNAAHARRYLGAAPAAAPARGSQRFPMAYAGFAVAAAAVVALFTTPLGTYAQSFLTVFEPKQVVALAVPPGVSGRRYDGFQDLRQIGTLHEARKPSERTISSLASAQNQLPFRVLSPTTWPQQLPRIATYRIFGSGTESFTFSAQKAREYSLRNAKRVVPIPAALDGARIDASVGPMVIASLGQDPARRKRYRAERTGEAPFLSVVESVAPRVTSTRVSFQQLKSFIATLPGVTPAMAAEIDALNENTLPIPFHPDKQNAHNVLVQGVQGLAIGDNTGLGAGVIWEKNGVFYGVGGTLPESDVLALANGLR